MCEECGCGTDHEQAHTHDHGHAHPHTHTHDGHTHTHPPAARTVKLEEKVLARNDAAAAANRAWLDERGVTALNLISSPGTGKTALLEATLDRLRDRVGCAVITGDQKTDYDARRLQNRGATVRQIETHNACHLDAARVGDLLPAVVGPDTRLLFIENVGNLVCPAAFDLGEHFKVALLSVTEGEDKPAKYPVLFSNAPVAVLTKTDLLPHLEFDLARCREFLRRVHPGLFVFELSARTGDGMERWIDYLLGLVRR
jgi:hydrogenase nickel incorporation protein HypB